MRSSSGGEDRNRQAWTWRDWLLPWAQVALAVGYAAVRAPALPIALCLAVLVAVPMRKEPFAHRRWFGWMIFLACGFWWGASAVSASAMDGYLQLLRVGGWCLAALGALQLATLGRGGSGLLVTWCALLATWLFVPRWAGWEGVAVLGVQSLLAVEAVRRIAAPGGAPRRILASWLAVLVVAAGAAAVWHRWGSSSWGMGGRWSQRESRSRIPGFSMVSRLGTFGASYLPDREGSVALRVWTRESPGLMKGMVHETYVNGSWIAATKPQWKTFERMRGDFGQFCRDASDDAPPVAWAWSSDSRVPVLFAPGGISCVGVVADSLAISATGVFKAPDAGVGRGWFWYGAAHLDSQAGPESKKVPASLAGLLDSAWTEIGDSIHALPPLRRTQALASWFAREFRYDLVVESVDGRDPLRGFLRNRRGYCEYFASAAVLLLRRSGIPARYVTGFSNPESVPGGGWWTYRQGSAHAWVEWLGDDGNWRILDPTPPDPEGRRERSAWMDLSERFGGWVRIAWHRIRDGNWRDGLDGLQNWSESVRWERWGGGTLLVGIFALLAIRRRRREDSRRGDWQKELAAAESLLRRRGHVRRPGETVGDFLARLPLDADPGAVVRLKRYQDARWRLK